MESDFYHKDLPNYFLDWIDTVSVKKEGGAVNHVMCNKKATIDYYLVDQGCITPHI